MSHNFNSFNSSNESHEKEKTVELREVNRTPDLCAIDDVPLKSETNLKPGTYCSNNNVFNAVTKDGRELMGFLTSPGSEEVLGDLRHTYDTVLYSNPTPRTTENGAFETYQSRMRTSEMNDVVNKLACERHLKAPYNEAYGGYLEESAFTPDEFKEIASMDNGNMAIISSRGGMTIYIDKGRKVTAQTDNEFLEKDISQGLRSESGTISDRQEHTLRNIGEYNIHEGILQFIDHNGNIVLTEFGDGTSDKDKKIMERLNDLGYTENSNMFVMFTGGTSSVLAKSINHNLNFQFRRDGKQFNQDSDIKIPISDLIRGNIKDVHTSNY